MQNSVLGQVIKINFIAIKRQLAGWVHIWQRRAETCHHLSLNHGDLHPGNIFYPLDIGCGLCFIDRDDLSTTDLVMLLTLNLAPHAEQALPLMKVYPSEFARLGITNYSCDDLSNDYPNAILYAIVYPMKLFTLSRIVDETMLQDALTACESFWCLESQ